MQTKWTSLWRKDEWWAVWIGLFIVALVATNIVVKVPKFNTWASINDAITLTEIPEFFGVGLFILILTSISLYSMKEKVKIYFVGFPIIFLFACIALLLAKQTLFSQYGIEYALWALLFGLVLNNVFKVPRFLKDSAKSELFIKIGLVILGAEILFNVILEAGARGLFEVTIGLALVWYFCYYIAKKLGLNKKFSAIMATATSVCGVSAAIAAGGAIKGDRREIGYIISLVMLFAVPMIVLMPIMGRVFDIPDVIFGAWVGGTIDNTASVAAAGALYSETALQIASVVKLSQNVLIGIVAFILAVYWTFREDRKGEEKPRPIEIWYRFPKFIVGFLIASLVFSFILVPTLGMSIVSGMTKITKGFRGWFFALTFVSVGLQTNFKELLKTGRGKPLLVFLAATVWDLIISLISAYVFFGGAAF